jgi:DNA modification methylase
VPTPKIEIEKTEQQSPESMISDLSSVLLQIADGSASWPDVEERLGALLAELPPAVRESLLLQDYRNGEARLTYAGKRTRGAILGDPKFAPLQTIKTFGEIDSSESWLNKLVFGDNLSVLHSLIEMKKEGKLKNSDGTDGVRLCYIDPPFATKREFSDKQGVFAYADKVAGSEFIEFVRERLVLIHDLLADNGTLFVHLDSKKVHYIKIVLDEIFGPESFRNELVWYYRSMSNVKKDFARKHDTILRYTKSSSFIFNIDLIRDPYDEKTLKRYESDVVFPGGYKAKANPLGKVPDDVLIIPPVRNVSSENSNYPTQKPMALLEKFVLSSSNEGDIVLDCFSGSGSTLRTAERFGRRWIGVDVGKLAIHTATRDLMKVEREDGHERAPFAVLHGGLYHHDELMRLPFKDWKAFVLALYDCRAKSGTVGGVEFDGKRGAQSSEKVIVFDWAAHPKAIVDEAYLRGLLNALSGHIHRGIVSVIIPQHLAPTLVADSIRQGGLEVRVLRVPPSMTALAVSGGFGRFSELSQPASIEQVNDAIRAHGFDFVIPPIVERDLSLVDGNPRVTLTRFEADGRRSEKTSVPEDGRDDLAFILLDYDHIDFGTHFDFEAVVWKSDFLAKRDGGLFGDIPSWAFDLDESALSQRVAVTWVDRLGNEASEIIEPLEWKGINE